MYTWLISGAALILIVGLHLFSDSHKATKYEKAQKNLISYRVAIDEQNTVNRDNLETISEITTANQAWADRFKSTVGDYNNSVIRLKAQIADERTKRKQDNLEAQVKLKEVLANDKASNDWAVQPVPDAIANIVFDTITPTNQDTEQ